jgi:hypothetical protein
MSQRYSADPFPELTGFEHECLRALVRTYGADAIAALAQAMEEDIKEDLVS